MVSALMKLAGGAPTLAEELNVDAFLRQARSYDEASAGPLGWYIRRALMHTMRVAGSGMSDPHAWYPSAALALGRPHMVGHRNPVQDVVSCAQKCSNEGPVPSLACDAGKGDRPVVTQSSVRGFAGGQSTAA